MGFGKPIYNDIEAEISKQLSFLKVGKANQKTKQLISWVVTSCFNLFSFLIIAATLVSLSLSGIVLEIMYGLMTIWFYFKTVRQVVPRELSKFEEDFQKKFHH